MIYMSVSWLRSMRWQGEGMKYVKFGASVRYSIDEIEKFIKDNTVQSTTELHHKPI